MVDQQQVPEILASIREQTRQLVAQNLRSKAVVIARLYDLIATAQKLGHKHESIYAMVVAGGLETSEKNYQVSLYRTRQARAMAGTVLVHENQFPQERGILVHTNQKPDGAVMGDAPSPAVVNPADSELAGSLGSAFATRSAFEAATDVGRKDYSSVVRNARRGRSNLGK